MNRTWTKFLQPLTPGVRGLLFLLSASFLAAMIGRISDAFDLYAWFALHPPSFWRGQIWQAVTYAVLPARGLDFLLNGFMIAWLGVWLERSWTRRELWLYCLLAAAGTGLARVALTPSSPVLMVGSGGMVFGLLAAWARLFGHERVQLMGVWEMAVRWAALLLAALSLAIMLPCAGPLNAFIMLGGGLAGWLYLSLRSKTIRARRSQFTANERMNRLEL